MTRKKNMSGITHAKMCKIAGISRPTLITNVHLLRMALEYYELKIYFENK